MRRERGRLTARLAGGVLVLAAVLAACTGGSDEPSPRGPDCGKALAKADGSAWTCTFSDDFTGSRLDPEKWVAQRTDNSGYRNGSECYGRDDNVQVADGVLSLTARRETKAFTCQDPTGSFTTDLTAGSVSTYERFSQAYGRYEVRAKMPKKATAGIHSALWLWPQQPTRYGASPSSGEIDIAEYYGVYPDRLIPYVHYVPAAADPNVTNNHCVVDDPQKWHRYLLEWTPEFMSISYDGRPCLVNQWAAAAPLTGRAPFDQPFIVVLTQALGVPTTANALTGSTGLPATMQVDWVRVWK